MDITFHDMWQTYATMVHRYALWLSGDSQMARDITSETFVRAWTSPSPKRVDSLRAYLLTIARHMYCEMQRERQRTVPLTGKHDALLCTDPVRESETRRTAELAITILQSFPEDERAALLLRIQEELSYQEIATILDISPAAARVRVHRARLKLQTMMNAQHLGGT